MNYEQNYKDLINGRKKLNRTKTDDNKYEKHHILPRSLGGKDEENNLILLTFREHFLAHYLLYKIYHNKQMISAYFIMFTRSGIIKSSRQYEKIRKEYINCISKKVVRLEDAKVYNSRTEAALDVGLNEYTSDIVRSIDLDNKTAGGYHWGTYIKEKDYTKNKWYGFNEKKYCLIRLEDLKKYETWKEAADDIKSTVGAISYAISTNNIGCAKGWHFSKYDPFANYEKNPFFGKEPIMYKRGQKIKCIETGEIFDSVNELSKVFKHDMKYILKHKKEYKGLHFVKLVKEQKSFGEHKKKKKIIYKIKCIETGEIFNTQKEVCEKYGMVSSGINRALKAKGKCKEKHWVYIDDLGEEIEL